MKIEYDQEADALYIQFKEAPPEDNIDIEEGVTVDLDKEGHMIGLEVLDAAARFGMASLLKVSIENMPLEKAPA
jgi:uncharacterized protein YuzE